ncbi:MAG: calcium-binding protein [Verrucomicrobiota bacterium]
MNPIIKITKQDGCVETLAIIDSCEVEITPWDKVEFVDECGKPIDAAITESNGQAYAEFACGRDVTFTTSENLEDYIDCYDASAGADYEFNHQLGNLPSAGFTLIRGSEVEYTSFSGNTADSRSIPSRASGFFAGGANNTPAPPTEALPPKPTPPQASPEPSPTPVPPEAPMPTPPAPPAPPMPPRGGKNTPEYGTNRPDEFCGTRQNEVYYGGNGGDLIDGKGGDDCLFGENGRDEIYGGGGDDYIDGGKGADNLIGGKGDDEIYGRQGNDSIHGEEGNDFIYGGHGQDVITGGCGDDTIQGGAGDDYIEGNAGNDHLSGGAGNDMLLGQKGDDTLIGAAGDDYLYGGDGNDHIEGGKGCDTISGGAGDDFLVGGKGDDHISGGKGADSIFAGAGHDVVEFAQAANDFTVSANADGSLSFNAGGATDTVYGAEVFYFAESDTYVGADMLEDLLAGDDSIEIDLPNGETMNFDHAATPHHSPTDNVVAFESSQPDGCIHEDDVMRAMAEAAA